MDIPSYMIACGFLKNQFSDKLSQQIFIWYDLCRWGWSGPYIGMETFMHFNRILKYMEKYG